MLKKGATVFDNGTNYYYHFIVKELAVKFYKKIICVGENTEKCSVPIAKKLQELIKREKEL